MGNELGNFQCCPSTCQTNVEKALCKIAEAEKYKPTCCQVINNGIPLNNFLSAIQDNAVVAGNSSIVFNTIVSQSGTLITFTAPSSSFLLEENHTYQITVFVSGTTTGGDTLSFNAIANGNPVSTVAILNSNVIDGYNTATVTFYLTITDDTLLTIDNLNASNLADASASINILAIG